MLRVHFLNVGHGECTLIEHSSNRLTMVDINNSQEYDQASFREYLAQRSGGQSVITTGLLGIPLGFGSGGRPLGLMEEVLREINVKEAAKAEITDPIALRPSEVPRTTIVQVHPYAS